MHVPHIQPTRTQNLENTTYNTLIKTEKGKTILLQFDVHTGRPYSRINKVVGTKAVHDGYPSRLYIDSENPDYWGHNWLNDDLLINSELINRLSIN